MTPDLNKWLAETQARCDAATKGPWHRCDSPWGDGTTVHAGPSGDPHTATYIVCWWDSMTVQFNSEFDGIDCDDICEANRTLENMAFIAHARTDLPRALEIIRQQAAEIERLRACLNSVHAVLHKSPELNMSNYTEDEVAELNSGACEAYTILDRCLSGENDA